MKKALYILCLSLCASLALTSCNGGKDLSSSTNDDSSSYISDESDLDSSSKLDSSLEEDNFSSSELENESDESSSELDSSTDDSDSSKLPNSSSKLQSSSSKTTSNSSKPNSSKPNSSKPNSSKPNSSKPNSSKPNSSKPNSSKPNSSKPNSSKPNSSKPNSSKPSSSKPDSSSSSSSTAATSASDIISSIYAQPDVLGTRLLKLSDGELEVLYGVKDTSILKSYCAYTTPISPGGRDIALFEVKDKKSIDTVKGYIQVRIDMLTQSAFYPAERENIENAQIIVKGNYVLFIADFDADVMVSNFNDLF